MELATVFTGSGPTRQMETTLGATLDFLVERARYITGASGAAIALREGTEMVCRARSGPSTPPLGLPLQTTSSLSGECIRTGQILHCRSVETDERVDVGTCRQLGVESILVMPLYRQQRIAGLFEVFSALPQAFEERDVSTLKRVGMMVQEALQGSLAWQENYGVASSLGFYPVKKPRRFERYDIGVPLMASLLRSGVPDSIPGRSINLGEGGLGAILAGALPQGAEVVLEFPLPLVRKPLRMRAAVRDQERLRHGFEFLTPRLEDRNERLTG